MMDADPPGIRIIRARAQSLADINGLIVRSKSHGTWPTDYLDGALPLHKISLAYLRNNHCFEARDARDILVAFFTIEAGDTRVLLDNVWVTPDRIGQGIGRQACAYLFRLAREQGWTQLWVLPDPPAAGFYLKMGFHDTGERVPSRVPGGPVFGVYRINPWQHRTE